jgi:predicted aminopeptidase
VAGCVAYRGYFDLERAERFGRKLEARGFDTFVGGSAAYSTLGHFADPILNTMLIRGDTEIAAMLFHELAHQRIYVKDDTELSESFATAVEQYAVEVWLEQRDDPEALDRYRAQLGRQREFAGLIARQRERLEAVFAQELPVATLRRQKAAAYEQLRLDYAALKDGWNGVDDYGGWFDGGFNNARLVALTSYQRWVPGLRMRIDSLGPAAFYAEMAELAELAPQLRQETLAAWNTSVVTALPDQR